MGTFVSLKNDGSVICSNMQCVNSLDDNFSDIMLNGNL